MRSLAVLLAFALLNAGCATLYAGTHQRVSFTSEPPGARVALDGKHLECLTPCTLEVPRGPKPINYEAAMPTREPFTGELINTPNLDLPWWIVGGTFFETFLIVPAIVDLTSGALYQYPDEAAFTLPPQGQGGARVVLKR